MLDIKINKVDLIGSKILTVRSAHNPEHAGAGPRRPLSSVVAHTLRFNLGRIPMHLYVRTDVGPVFDIDLPQCLDQRLATRIVIFLKNGVDGCHWRLVFAQQS